jgi:hypothetical protein
MDVFDAFKALASYPDDPLPEAGLGSVRHAAVTSTPTFGQARLDIDDTPTGRPTLSRAITGSRARAPWAGPPLWMAGAGVLAVLLCVQLAYVFREPLASSGPSMRAVLERICALAGCTVPLPRRTDVLAIEASDLQADPKRPSVIVLSAVLRNRGSVALEYPALELTLTNAQDQAIARRILLPQDYLERSAEIGAGMRAAAELNVRIELDTGELKPSGYRLFLFYP